MNGLQMEGRAVSVLRAYAAGCARLLMYSDAYHYFHCREVGNHAVLLGVEYGLDAHDLQILRAAAENHDTGKLALIPILMATNHLTLAPTDPRMHCIRTHAEIGAQSIESMMAVLPLISETLSVVATIVRHHHERFDGTGYPSGLAGYRIPLMSRIIGIADAAKSMTTPERQWRNPMSVPQMMAELTRCAGTQFDPELARLYCGLIKDNRLSFPMYEGRDRVRQTFRIDQDAGLSGSAPEGNGRPVPGTDAHD